MAVIVNDGGVSAGTAFGDGLRVRDSIPQAHKVALRAIAAEMIERIMALAERRLHELDQRRRETCPASALVLGMQCGGSDAFSERTSPSSFTV